VHKNLPVGETVWRWFNEDYDTPIAFLSVGAPSNKAPGFYIATGFNAWGISNGTAAGMLMADQIRGRSNPWANLYAPARPSSKNFNKGGESPAGIASIADLAPGEGGVIKDGKQKLAVWKDDNGQPHALSATCTHKGCTGDLEQCRAHLGLPVSRIDVQCRRHRYSRPGGQATADQESTCETASPRATIGLATAAKSEKRGTTTEIVASASRAQVFP
jgi:nitrite reductase/ring-hydroxylating ferredoxin subunit